MANPKHEQGLRRTRPWHQKLALAALGALTGSMVWVATGGATAVTAQSAPRVTVAALDPALVAGRGADVGFVEQEAENAATNGTVIGPDRTPTRWPPRRRAGRRSSSRPGSTSSSRCRSAANAITVRYSIPDAPDRRRHHRAAATSRSTAAAPQTMTLTSQYSWLYNQYPFSQRPERRPAAPRLVDHRVRVRARGHHADADDHHAVPARCTSTTSSGCCSARPTRPATRSGSPSRPAATPRGRSSTCSTPSWSAPPHVQPHRGRTCCCSAPTRPAGATRPTRSTRRSRSPSART